MFSPERKKMNIEKMIRKCAILLSVCFTMPLSAEVLGSWPEGGENMLQAHASPRKTVKIISNKTEFTVELKENLNEKTRVQIEFKKPYTLSAGKKYRFTIEAKADRVIELNACVVRAKAPYSTIPKSWKVLRLKPEYRTFRHEFAANKDYDVELYTPVLAVRTGNAGTKITIREVTFEKLEESALPQQK